MNYWKEPDGCVQLGGTVVPDNSTPEELEYDRKQQEIIEKTHKEWEEERAALGLNKEEYRNLRNKRFEEEIKSWKNPR